MGAPWSADRGAPCVCRLGSGGDTGRSEDLDSVLGGDGGQLLRGGRLDGCRWEGEGLCRLGHRAHEVREGGGLGDHQEAGLRRGDEEGVRTSRGPYRNDPAGATTTSPPTQKVTSPSIT